MRYDRPMRAHWPLLLILAVYLFLGTLYALLTPPWQAPDEPAHYNYVRQLAAGHLPVMEPGDYDQDYLNEVVFESAFAPGYDLSVIEYEDWQPPLYYLLQTPAYAAGGGSLWALRLVSLWLGAGVIILAYAIVLRIAPGEQWLAQTTAVFVAFLPQHLALLASANNDALAELIIAAILFVLLGVGRREAVPRPAQLLLLGLLLGLGFLTKATVYPLALVIGVVLLWRFWSSWPDLLRAGALVFIPALLLGLLWWGRNVAVYGGLDVLGKETHDAVVVGQPRTAEWIAAYGLEGTAERLVNTTFNSFWGQFGWMTVPMTYPDWLYPLLWLLSGLALAGLLSAAFSARRRLGYYTLPLLVFLTLFGLTAGVYLYYNVQFVQHQGRYFFPALIPIATGFAVGLGIWSRPLRDRYPRIVYAIPLLLGLALVALDVYALFRVILPALA